MARTRTQSTTKAKQSSKEQSPEKSVTKQEAVIGLLRRKGGASLDEMITATSWQAHTVRGFLSGTVRKRLGLKLETTETKTGLRKYHLRRAS